MAAVPEPTAVGLSEVVMWSSSGPYVAVTGWVPYCWAASAPQVWVVRSAYICYAVRTLVLCAQSQGLSTFEGVDRGIPADERPFRERERSRLHPEHRAWICCADGLRREEPQPVRSPILPPKRVSPAQRSGASSSRCRSSDTSPANNSRWSAHPTRSEYRAALLGITCFDRGGAPSSVGDRRTHPRVGVARGARRCRTWSTPRAYPSGGS